MPYGLVGLVITSYLHMREIQFKPFCGLEFVIQIILEHDITITGCFEISVLLLTMFKVLEFSGIFVCLGRLVKIFNALGDRNCWVVVY